VSEVGRGKRLDPERIEEIRKFIKEGHTWDEAVTKFRCSRATIARALYPERYGEYYKRDKITRQMSYVAGRLLEFSKWGIVIDINNENYIVRHPSVEMTILVPRKVTTANPVLEYLEKHGAGTNADIQAGTGLSVRQVSDSLLKLEQKGKVFKFPVTCAKSAKLR